MSSAASSADAGRGAVYDRGYRPYDEPRGRRGAATLALYKASMRRARAAAPMAAEGGAVRAARGGHHPGHRQRRHRLRHPRPLRRFPDHHLSRVRRRLVGVAAVRGPRRTGCDVPRPAAPGAAADVRPAAAGRGLRGGQGRVDHDHSVRVLVPAAGGPLRRQHAGQQQRARLRRRSPRRAVEGAARSRSAQPVLRHDRVRARRSPIAASWRGRR